MSRCRSDFDSLGHRQVEGPELSVAAVQFWAQVLNALPVWSAEKVSIYQPEWIELMVQVWLLVRNVELTHAC